MSNNQSLEDWERELDEIIRRNHEAFLGIYADEINELMGLSRTEIDEITPGTTDLETYDKLIAVVKEASRKNISQAQLAERIRSLGEVAVAIAKKSANLAGILL